MTTNITYKQTIPTKTSIIISTLHNNTLSTTLSNHNILHYPTPTQYIISTPKIPGSAQKSLNGLNFERGFLYQPSQKWRTPLPTTQNRKSRIANFINFIKNIINNIQTQQHIIKIEQRTIIHRVTQQTNNQFNNKAT